jgi:hypothetical protein
MADELSISVDATVTVVVEVDHDHGGGKLVPMIEQEYRADLPRDGASARVFYRCPACHEAVSVSATAAAHQKPHMELGV